MDEPVGRGVEADVDVDLDVDVVVVGAGLSGVGAACHLRREAPQESLLVLEARERMGGTWDLFRYPGVRSDSDMFTLAYDFAPWRGERAIVEGADIRRYVEDTARAYGIDDRTRFGHRVVRAEWSGAEQRWRLTVAHAGDERVVTCRFLWVCTGYYRYDAGHQPALAGEEAFGGTLVDPQRWPEDLDVRDRDVVVLGSGATAVTLVPALAAQGARVTMLQRSPSYVGVVGRRDRWARRLSGRVPPGVADRVLRARHVLVQQTVTGVSRRRPDLVRRALLRTAAQRLPEGYDVEATFGARYDPWDQRLTVSPGGELFTAVRDGRAEVVTGTLERLTPDGVLMTSGREVPADVLVRATGLEMLGFGGMEVVVDDEPVVLGERLAYAGVMLEDVPNLAFTVGYARASWTLRADLVAHWVTRLLRRMRREGLAVVTPDRAPAAEHEARRPLIDLNSGYVRRGRGRMPEQGAGRPWRSPGNHLEGVAALRWRRRTPGLRTTPAGSRA
ncbi:Predicted flavoprotein CzcO associated with the cation diffusion facilitator CzcD [Microlunatus sagamiharensis]|uniref:Predicted flavoprotein CzcO associated with the cation diffusion facilitator CzcD n=1 Tax=Microlunatus sagamiharensis TaxID=546874 RepID=A0A1H2N639_9ACTN|nr:NAD(P)/FAD-dependent oxidoreductase [Microlunatus sagamiharensis]SDV00256.1 Predicted flavoprotein CzcO associated with the cation diffusion facilitator CzcD [Microlunatus sagamiharensis]